jgi:hypothetical protein
MLFKEMMTVYTEFENHTKPSNTNCRITGFKAVVHILTTGLYRVNIMFKKVRNLKEKYILNVILK